MPRVGDARDDWAILRALSEVLGKPLSYNSPDDVRSRLADVSPHFAQVDTVQAPIWLNGEYFKVGLLASCIAKCTVPQAQRHPCMHMYSCIVQSPSCVLF